MFENVLCLRTVQHLDCCSNGDSPQAALPLYTVCTRTVMTGKTDSVMANTHVTHRAITQICAAQEGLLLKTSHKSKPVTSVSVRKTTQISRSGPVEVNQCRKQINRNNSCSLLSGQILKILQQMRSRHLFENSQNRRALLTRLLLHHQFPVGLEVFAV